MTCPLPSSLSHDAGHTTGWKDAPWQGAGPFPKMSGEEEEEDKWEREEEWVRRSCYMPLCSPLEKLLCSRRSSTSKQKCNPHSVFPLF